MTHNLMDFVTSIRGPCAAQGYHDRVELIHADDEASKNMRCEGGRVQEFGRLSELIGYFQLQVQRLVPCEIEL